MATDLASFQRLSPREYEIFETWARGSLPFFGVFQLPANREGIRDNKLYKRFVKERPFARITETTRQKAEAGGFLQPLAVAALPTPQERIRPARQAAGVDLTGGKPPTTGLEVPPFPASPPPPGFRWAFDRDLNRWVPQFAGLSPQQEAQQTGFPSPGGQPPTDAFGRTPTWNPRTGQYDFPPNYGQRPGDQPAPISPFQQQQFGLQQQQVESQQQQFQQQLEFQQQQAQQQAELQRQQEMARLAANPINWLQYSAFTGEQPVQQPWMVPLGFQGTGTNIAPQGVQPGQPIPGVQGSNFSNLPALRTPSAQLQARWGPTAQAQWLGYSRARTGASPEETSFRAASGRAPAGRFQGFSGFGRT